MSTAAVSESIDECNLEDAVTVGEWGDEGERWNGNGGLML